MYCNARLSHLLLLLLSFTNGILPGNSVAATAKPPVTQMTTDTRSADAAQDTPVDMPPDDAKAIDSKGENEIEIRGVRRPDDLPYRSFVDAMHVFDQNHHYAPDAPLKFVISTHGSKHDGLRVSVAGDNVVVPVSIDKKGRFTVPIRQDALDDDASVMSNKREGEVSWGVDIRTPGLPDDTDRLGDLRLECRVFLELQRKETSIWVSALTRVLGGCNSDGHITFGLKRPGMRVKLIYKNREEILPDRYYVVHHTVWTAPLTDGNWPDDTLVQFIEPDSSFVLDPECAEKLAHDAEHPYTHGVKNAGTNACMYRPYDDDN
jgi:hypothetical protein